MQKGDGADGAGGGRARIPTFGLCKDKWLILFIIILLANLSRLYYEDDGRNAETTLRLIQEHPLLSRYGITESEIRSVFTFIAANNNFLVMRRNGRTPDLNIHFEELSAETDRLLHLNLQGDQHSLEDIYDNFVRILRYISDNEDRFIAPTSRIRVLHNFRVLLENYPPNIRQRIQNFQVVPENQDPMTMYQLGRLQTGFAYINRSHIPLSNGSRIPEDEHSKSITTLPGFAPIFNRALNQAFLRSQLSSFFANHPNGRGCSIRDGGEGIGMVLENTGEEAIPPESVCCAYTGFLTRRDTESDNDEEHGTSTRTPSDKKINISIEFTSFGNPEIHDDEGMKLDKRVPITLKWRKEKMSLIGWSGDMVPIHIRGGAEMASHSCTPNSFLKSAKNDENNRPFTLSGTFNLPHYVNHDINERLHYDSLKFSFEPLFLHTNQNEEIQLGGRCCVDYGTDIVDYSDFHIEREAVSKKCNKVIAKSRNSENRKRLESKRIRPIPCLSKCCDEAVEHGDERSKLYFDGTSTSIDYNAVKEMLLGQKNVVETNPQDIKKNVKRKRQPDDQGPQNSSENDKPQRLKRKTVPTKMVLRSTCIKVPVNNNNTMEVEVTAEPIINQTNSQVLDCGSGNSADSILLPPADNAIVTQQQQIEGPSAEVVPQNVSQQIQEVLSPSLDTTQQFQFQVPTAESVLSSPLNATQQQQIQASTTESILSPSLDTTQQFQFQVPTAESVLSPPHNATQQQQPEIQASTTESVLSPSLDTTQQIVGPLSEVIPQNVSQQIQEPATESTPTIDTTHLNEGPSANVIVNQLNEPSSGANLFGIQSEDIAPVARVLPNSNDYIMIDLTTEEDQPSGIFSSLISWATAFFFRRKSSSKDRREKKRCGGGKRS